jgi:phosphomannomutase / phosphoglucomutase
MPGPVGCGLSGVNLNLTAFQPCDVRGQYGESAQDQVSAVHAYLLGRVLAGTVPTDETLLLAGDGRSSTPRLLAMLEAGFGRPCLNLGPAIPTPLAYFAKSLFHSCGLAIVTASHNPARFNGFKLQVGDRPVQPGQLEQWREEVAHLYSNEIIPPFAPSTEPELFSGSAKREEAWACYKRRCAEAFGPQPAFEMRVAVDCMHGCYSRRAGEALTEMGYDVIPIRDQLAGDFQGGIPDPAQDANLAGLSSIVSHSQAVFGFALDGDGDRARFADEKGNLLDNGTLFVLLVRFLIKSGRGQEGDKVVYDQKMRLAVVRALRDLGVEPLIEKSGHTFIRTRMLREDALFGGENSGHFFWGDGLHPVPAGDCGLFAALAVGAMLRFFGQPLSQLAASVPLSPFYTGDIRSLRYDGNREALLAGMASMADRDRCVLGTQDGLRIETGAAFAHLRPSVTESNMLTAVFDAEDAQSLAAVRDLIIDLLPPEASNTVRLIKEAVAKRL